MSQNYFIPLSELESKINSIIGIIGFDDCCPFFPDNLPFITFGKILYQYMEKNVEFVPFVLIHHQQYYFGTTERGEIVDAHYSNNYRDVIYWFFKGISAICESHYWKMCPETDLDQRRYFFKKRMEIFYKIGPEYGDRCKKELNKLISGRPFRDSCPNTLDYLDSVFLSRRF